MNSIIQEKYAGSKLLDYYLANPNSKLEYIMISCLEDSYNNSSISDRLQSSYSQILEEKMDNIVMEIIDGEQSFENYVIAGSAIQNDRPTVIKKILDMGFNPNIGVPDPYNNNIITGYNNNLLYIATNWNNFQLINMLIDYGADISFNNYDAVSRSNFNSTEILDLYLSMNLPLDILNQKLYKYITTFSSSYIDPLFIIKLIEHGASVSYIYTQQNYFNIISRLDVNTIKLLEEHGLILDQNILNSACCGHNYDLVEYMLSKGHIPDNNIIESVFRSVRMNIIKIFLKYRIDLYHVNQMKTSVDSVNIVKNIVDSGITIEKLVELLLDR